MNRIYWAIAFIFISLVLIFAYGRFTTHKSTELAVAPVQEAPDLREKANAGKPIEGEASNSSIVLSDKEELSRAHQYICVLNKIECISEPLAAASQEEALWLVRSGYPSYGDADELASTSISKLTLRAGKGDLAAQAALGTSLIKSGDTKKGLGVLQDASAKGSVYAAYGLAEAYAAEGSNHNPLESAAYLRLAYLEGDWKAAEQLAKISVDFNAAENLMVDRRAMNLYGNLLNEKANSRYKLQIWPRPQ